MELWTEVLSSPLTSLAVVDLDLPVKSSRHIPVQQRLGHLDIFQLVGVHNWDKFFKFSKSQRCNKIVIVICHEGATLLTHLSFDSYNLYK